MIPKIIHYVWLSGESKPEIYQRCLDSWKEHMPDFELREWTMTSLPEEVLQHSFVKSAIKEKKWAFATDYIRLWALYNFGGVYMDLDVMVFKSLEPFLKHSVFTSVEFNPKMFYLEIKRLKKTADKKYLRGLNIEPAVIGSVRNHSWIKDIIEYYSDKIFVNTLKCANEFLMPRVVTIVSLNYGFKYLPVYQVLEQDVHIYPPDTFSSCYDWSITRGEEKNMQNNVIRYAAHLIAHGWWDYKRKGKWLFLIKRKIIAILGKNRTDKLKALFANNTKQLYS